MEKLQGIFGKSRNIWILFIAWILFASNLWLPRNWGFYGEGDWDLTDYSRSRAFAWPGGQKGIIYF